MQCVSICALTYSVSPRNNRDFKLTEFEISEFDCILINLLMMYIFMSVLCSKVKRPEDITVESLALFTIMDPPIGTSLTCQVENQIK